MPQRKNKAILIRTEEDVIQNFKKFMSENKVATYGEGLKCYQVSVGSEVFLEYEECEFFSEYPPDSKHFIQCSYGKSGKRPRKREHCQACAHNRVIRVLMKSRGKIEQENSERQHRLEDMKTEIVKQQHTLGDLHRETEKIENLLSIPEQLKKKDKEIADLRAHYEKELKMEKDKTDYLENELKAEKEKNDEKPPQRQFENIERPPKSVLEVEKRLSEQEQPITAPLQKVEASKPVQTIQRVTEREKTTEKERIVETIPSDPFTNQEIECPLKKRYVDIAKECKKSCGDISECPHWLDICKGTVPLGAKIRLRES